MEDIETSVRCSEQQEVQLVRRRQYHRRRRTESVNESISNHLPTKYQGIFINKKSE